MKQFHLKSFKRAAEKEAKTHSGQIIDLDTKKIGDIIRYVAATEVMPRFNNLQKSDIREKAPGDLVTVADEAAERLLSKLLQKALPGSLIVGEEAVSKDKTVLEKLKGGQPVWIIDPIDGTKNFSRGSKKFGILVALVQNGVTQYGWAYDVPGDRMAIAKKGAGAFLNGKPVKIAGKATGMKDMTGRGYVQNTTPPAVKEVVRQGSSLHDFLDFITGKTDFIAYTHVKPWDHAAGALIAQEAGGYVAMNKAKAPFDPTLEGKARFLVATNQEWWGKLFAVFHPKDPVVQPNASFKK